MFTLPNLIISKVATTSEPNCLKITFTTNELNPEDVATLFKLKAGSVKVTMEQEEVSDNF